MADVLVPGRWTAHSALCIGRAGRGVEPDVQFPDGCASDLGAADLCLNEDEDEDEEGPTWLCSGSSAPGCRAGREDGDRRATASCERAAPDETVAPGAEAVTGWRCECTEGAHVGAPERPPGAAVCDRGASVPPRPDSVAFPGT